MTLRRLIRKTKLLFQSHGLVQRVEFGNPGTDTGRLPIEDRNYPCIWFQLAPASSTASASGVSTLSRRLQVWVMDRLESDAQNELDVWSDTESIALDVMALLEKELDEDNAVLAKSGLQVTYFSDGDPDLVAGVMVDATIRVPLAWDTCYVPYRERNYNDPGYDENFS